MKVGDYKKIKTSYMKVNLARTVQALMEKPPKLFDRF